MSSVVTLGHLADAGADVLVRCWVCHRDATLPLAPLLARYGRAFPLLALAPKCRCARCGASRAEVRPAWPVAAGQICRYPGDG